MSLSIIVYHYIYLYRTHEPRMSSLVWRRTCSSSTTKSYRSYGISNKTSFAHCIYAFLTFWFTIDWLIDIGHETRVIIGHGMGLENKNPYGASLRFSTMDSSGVISEPCCCYCVCVCVCPDCLCSQFDAVMCLLNVPRAHTTNTPPPLHPSHRSRCVRACAWNESMSGRGADTVWALHL